MYKSGMTLKAVIPEADVGVIVGRFQVHELHPGHRALIDFVRGRHQKTIVVLGCGRMEGSRRNPLDVQSRQQMLRESYPDLLLGHVFDQRTDERWSDLVDEVIRPFLSPAQSVMLYGSRDSFIPYYKGKFRTQALEGEGEFWNASEIRKRIAKSTLPSADFRAGVIWRTCAEWPRVTPTVDIACFYDAQRRSVVLIQKDGEEGWRFPGGFCEPGSPNYESDALRELREECGGDLEVGGLPGLQCVGNCNINDWRLRGEPGAIRTTIFVCTRQFGALQAGDDAARVDVFDWKEVKSRLVPEHLPVFEIVNNWLFPF